MLPLTTLAESRQIAIELFRVGIEAADPYLAVRKILDCQAGAIRVRRPDGLKTYTCRKAHLIAIGKAACPMAKAAIEIFSAAAITGRHLVITNYENVVSIPGIDVREAGHPLPDNAGFQAAKACAENARAAQAGELVLVMLSGGGSALLPCPVDPVTLEEKIRTTELLLASGATINQINCVRKHLSQLKGGGLAKLTAPASVHALILSDVLGDDVSSIASGPTVPDKTTFFDAKKILHDYALWDRIPNSVRSYIESGIHGISPETPKPDDKSFDASDYTLVGSNRMSLEAVKSAAEAKGMTTLLYSDGLCGEAKRVGQELAEFSRFQSRKYPEKPLAIIAGGETTVTLNGSGKGGRNQEMALAFAHHAEHIGLTGNWAFLSGGTDGRDGPTDAAGAVVDRGTLQRIRQMGLNPEGFLANNDSYHALKTSGDLLMTGATGTNVADLQILITQPQSAI